MPSKSMFLPPLLSTRRLAVAALLLSIASLAMISFVAAAGNKTQTHETRESETLSLSEPSLTPEASRSFTQSMSLSGSSSQTFSGDPGICSAEFSVFPLSYDTIPYSEIVNAPEMKLFERFHFNRIASTELAVTGFSVAVRLQHGVFFPQVDRSLAFRIHTKSQLIEGALVPAEQYASAEASAEYVSPESHGFNDFWPSRPQRFLFKRSNRQIALTVLPLPGYRIATDEWIIVQFFYNATAPLGCATKPAVLRITAPRPSFYVPVIGALALFVMVAGIIAAAAQQTIPSSHHASMVAILANAHFAMEDGTTLPLALSPFQISFGTTKYRYVYGAMYGNAGIILISFLGQHLAMRYIMKKKGVKKDEAARTVLYPRLTSATVLMFAGSVMWGCGRNFGNQTSLSYFVTSFVLIFTVWVLVKTHRVNISSTMAFQAEFVENQEPNAHPLLPNREVISNVNDTFLSSLRSKLTLQRCGFWKPVDVSGSFVLRFGYVFENYKPEVKTWLLFECIDIAVTSLLSVFDNYSVFLAFFQFALTLVTKFAMLLGLIWKKPIIASQSSVAMMANYGGQTVGYLALAIGSLRLELRPSADIVQGVAATIAMLGLLYDVLVHATTGVFHFYDLYNRQKTFEEHDETNEYRLELTDTFRRGKTGEELAQIEREAQLSFWWDHFGRPKREEERRLEDAVARDRRDQRFLLDSNGSFGRKPGAAAADVNNNSFAENTDRPANANAGISPAQQTPLSPGAVDLSGGGVAANDLSPEFKEALEQDRDWIFGKAQERQRELPLFQQIPRWNRLSFEEHTAFFRALFRGELAPARRKAFEEQLERERQAKIRVETDSEEDDMELVAAREREVEGAPILVNSPPQSPAKQQQPQQQDQFANWTSEGSSPFLLTPRGLTPTFDAASISNASFGSAAAAAAAASASASAAAPAQTHAAFSYHYDADGIFIDRYHPQYKQNKAAREQRRQEVKKRREEELAKLGSGTTAAPAASKRGGGATTGAAAAASTAASGDGVEPRQMTKEETFAAAAKAAAADARANALAVVSRSGNARTSYHNEVQLARAWEAIGRRATGTLPQPALTEQDFLSL